MDHDKFQGSMHTCSLLSPLSHSLHSPHGTFYVDYMELPRFLQITHSILERVRVPSIYIELIFHMHLLISLKGEAHFCSQHEYVESKSTSFGVDLWFGLNTVCCYVVGDCWGWLRAFKHKDRKEPLLIHMN